MQEKREMVTTLYRGVQRESERTPAVTRHDVLYCSLKSTAIIILLRTLDNTLTHQGSSPWNNYPRNKMPLFYKDKWQYHCQTDRCDCPLRAGRKLILLYQISISPEDHKGVFAKVALKEVKCKSPSWLWHGLSTHGYVWIYTVPLGRETCASFT